MASRLRFRAISLAALVFMTMPAGAEPPALDVYGNLPGIEDMAISPSGKGLAVVARVEGARRLMIFGPGMKLQTTAPASDAKVRYINWIGEESVLAVVSRTNDLGYGFTADKFEFYGALLVPAQGNRIEMIFANRPSMVRAIFGDHGRRQVDGKWVGYFGGVELKRSGDGLGYLFEHGRPALFAVDIAGKGARKLAPAAADGHKRDWLVDERGIVSATLDLAFSDGRWKITNQSSATIATGTAPTGGIDLVGFGKDGTSVVYLDEDGGNGSRFMEVPLAGGAAQQILAGIDIERAFVDPTNGRLLGYLQGGSTGTPVLFDPARQAMIRKVYSAFPGLDLRIVEWTPDFGHFLVRTSGNGDSGSWYIVDMAARRADPVGNDYPLIPPKAVGPISTFAYKAADGLALDGVLTLPPDRAAKNLPVVMLPHGGPHSHDSAAFDWWAQAFASRGYAVFQPNFRGSTNRDEAFRNAGNGEWGRKMQSDVSDGLAALAKQGLVDPRRACIVGASYGGYAALAGVTLQQGLYRCAVAVAPVSDLSDMYWTDYRETGGNKMVKRQLERSLGDPAGFAAVSPRRHATKADAPILLVHGRDDTVVPFKQSEAMADALRNAGKPYELVILRGEDHWLSRAATRKQMLQASVAFVQKHNPAN